MIRMPVDRGTAPFDHVDWIDRFVFPCFNYINGKDWTCIDRLKKSDFGCLSRSLKISLFREELELSTYEPIEWDQLFYLAGPYSANRMHERDENIFNARVAAIKLWVCGLAVLCPHLNTCHFEEYVINKGERYFLDQYVKMLSRVSGVIVLPNWEYSNGTIEEIQYCHDHAIPVYDYEDVLREVWVPRVTV